MTERAVRWVSVLCFEVDADDDGDDEAEAADAADKDEEEKLPSLTSRKVSSSAATRSISCGVMTIKASILQHDKDRNGSGGVRVREASAGGGNETKGHISQLAKRSRCKDDSGNARAISVFVRRALS